MANRPKQELVRSITLNKKALSLLEIIISTVILALVMAGLTNIFVAAKRQVMHARDRMSSSEMGKLFVDPLQTHVRQDTWNTAGNALTAGTTYCKTSGGTQNPVCPSIATQRIVNRVDFEAKYEIDTVLTNLRRVKVTVSWTEPPA